MHRHPQNRGGPKSRSPRAALIAKIPRSIAALASMAMLFFCSQAAEYGIRWSDAYVEAGDIDAAALGKVHFALENWQQIFSVRADQSNPISDMNLPAMHGSYQVVSNAIRFQPAFPFDPGVNY